MASSGSGSARTNTSAFDTLHSTMLDFMIAYLTNGVEPNFLDQFALDFFTKKKNGVQIQTGNANLEGLFSTRGLDEELTQWVFNFAIKYFLEGERRDIHEFGIEYTRNRIHFSRN